jgi:hypothetical protein
MEMETLSGVPKKVKIRTTTFCMAIGLCASALAAYRGAPVPVYNVDPSWPKTPLRDNWLIQAVPWWLTPRAISPNSGRNGHPPQPVADRYFNVVHGSAADPVTRRVYVSDRGNRRMQVFDENRKFIDQWPFATPSSVNF